MLLLLALTLLAPTHTNSQSSSRLTVEDETVRLELRCEALSLFETVPQLDRDGDGLLTRGELRDAYRPVTSYLGEHYVLRAGTVILAPEPSSLDLVPPDPRMLFPGPQLVDVAFLYEGSEPITSLEIEVTLFHDTSPDHRDFAQVLWNGEGPTGLVLDRRRPRARFPQPVNPGRSPGAGAAGALHFLRLGVQHILSGWDHLAFLLALLLAARSAASLVGVVTAFTVSHSITLALASLDLVHVPGTMVEVAIALSIAYVGADNLLYPKARAKWPEAFGFGLIHGLGFASFLGESLLAESSKLWALVAFNVGVELGQVSVVLLVVVVLALARRWGAHPQREPEAGLVTPGWRRAGSIAVTLLGLYWFVERAWL